MRLAHKTYLCFEVLLVKEGTYHTGVKKGAYVLKSYNITLIISLSSRFLYHKQCSLPFNEDYNSMNIHLRQQMQERRRRRWS
jgi:hypothetical protein